MVESSDVSIVVTAQDWVALKIQFSCVVVSLRGHSSFVANFAQEVVKGQLPLSVEGIRRPGRRTVRPQ
jgi:hypothetical protein